MINRYGWVWCPECNEFRERRAEIEPLPRCKNEHWMEPVLCDEGKCEAEAVSKERGLFYCVHHNQMEVAA